MASRVAELPKMCMRPNSNHQTTHCLLLQIPWPPSGSPTFPPLDGTARPMGTCTESTRGAMPCMIARPTRLGRESRPMGSETAGGREAPADTEVDALDAREQKRAAVARQRVDEARNGGLLVVEVVRDEAVRELLRSEHHAEAEAAEQRPHLHAIHALRPSISRATTKNHIRLCGRTTTVR